jgi:hypothetical protein
MQRFRAFTSASWDDDLAGMEKAINGWLDSDHPHIHMMAQASLGEHLVVSFVYADNFQMATGREAATVAEVFERQLQDSGFAEEQEEAEVDLGITLPVMELPY